MTLSRHLRPALLGSLATVTLGLNLVACSGSDANTGPGTPGDAGAAGDNGGGNSGNGGNAAAAGTAGSSGSGGSSGGSGGSSGGGSGSGGSPGGGSGTGSGGTGGGSAIVDNDGDGLDDEWEQSVARDYLPFYSIHPDDKEPRHGMIYRLTPHPEDASKIMIWYDVLYEKDGGSLFGVGAHVGDNEVFGVVVDPNMPAPDGILAIRAISHQGTLCEGKTTCGQLNGCTPCATGQRNGAAFPVVFSSVNKHGSYVIKSTCDINACDIGGCELAAAADDPPLLNAGEPGAPLITNLTTHGFINSANGWTEQDVMNYDPWGGNEFGGAGEVSGDLVDMAFVISPSGC